MNASQSFLELYKVPSSQLKSVELTDLPTPKQSPTLHAETFVEMQEYSRRRVRATVHFHARTEPRGLIEFRSSWNVQTVAHDELPPEKEFEQLMNEFLYSAATKNSLLLAFLTSEMAADGASLVLSPSHWIENISAIGWEALRR